MSAPDTASGGASGSDARPIALVTALPMEGARLAGRLGGATVERLGRLRLYRGTLSGRRVALLATGDGAARAERGLSLAIDRLAPTALLAMGVAGGLAPDLAVGDLVLARRVVDRDGASFAPPRWRWSARAEGLVARRGSVFSAPRIVGSAEGKRRLWREGGSAAGAVVDLESATWARLAAAADLPWLVLRAVSDPADEDLPLDFERFRGADGRVRGRRVMAHALAHPSLVGDLRELRARVGRCARILADAAEEILAW